MNNQTVNSGKKQKQRDPDLAAAEIAMKYLKGAKTSR